MNRWSFETEADRLQVARMPGKMDVPEADEERNVRVKKRMAEGLVAMGLSKEAAERILHL